MDMRDAVQAPLPLDPVLDDGDALRGPDPEQVAHAGIMGALFTH